MSEKTKAIIKQFKKEHPTAYRRIYGAGYSEAYTMMKRHELKLLAQRRF